MLPQLTPGEPGSLTKRIIHTAVYKQKLTQYNNALKHIYCFNNIYTYIDELPLQRTAELDKIIANFDCFVTHFNPTSNVVKF